MTLLTRSDCCLCDAMAEVITEVAPEFSARIEIRDIDDDPQLRASFSNDVPVLLVNGRRAFKYRVTAAQLRRRLARGARPWWRPFILR